MCKIVEECRRVVSDIGVSGKQEEFERDCFRKQAYSRVRDRFQETGGAKPFSEDRCTRDVERERTHVASRRS